MARTRLIVYAALVGVSVVVGLVLPRMKPRAAATSEAVQPPFRNRVVGAPELRTAVWSNLTQAPYWAFYGATAYGRAQEIVFTLTSKRRALGGSGYGQFERGFARVTIEVSVADGTAFTIADSGETPAVMPMRPNVDAQDAAFEYAEEQAIDKLMPYVCGRLLRRAGDPSQFPPMLAFLETQWPGDAAFAGLRGLGPAAAPFSDRVRVRFDSQLAAKQYVDRDVLTLLDIDEARGADVVAAWAEDDDSKTYVINQHLELQSVENSVGILRGMASVDRVPWAAALTSAGAKAVLEFAMRRPGVLEACAATLAKFDASDAAASAAIESLKKAFPAGVDQIMRAVAGIRR